MCVNSNYQKIHAVNRHELYLGLFRCHPEQMMAMRRLGNDIRGHEVKKVKLSIPGFTGCFIITVTRVFHNFNLRGDFSHKTVHRWKEDIILGHIIHILDVLLARTECCKRLTDSNPAWRCDHLENLYPRRRHELVAWGAVCIRLNQNCMA